MSMQLPGAPDQTGEQGRVREQTVTRFLLLYALANAGGVIAYLPLLTLLLPIKVAAVAGPERLGVLTWAALTGAVAASVANVGWGWASDGSVARGRSRKPWVIGGVIMTTASYLGLLAAETPIAIVAAVIAFQIAVNAILAPLAAMLADRVPEGQRGFAGGLLVLAGPLASLVSVGLIAVDDVGDTPRYLAICLIVAVLVMPVLALPGPRELQSRTAPVPARDRVHGWRLAWLARLMVQVAGIVLSIYLLYFFASVAGAGVSPASLARPVGQIQMMATALPLPLALIAGRLSDRSGRRGSFLFGTAALAATGLMMMAVARGWSVAVAGYGLYACGSAIFLGLHNVFAMRMLPSPRHHGRDLGLLNLTNTLPSLIGPGLTWLLATADDFRTIMLLLAALTLGGGVLMAAIPGRRAPETPGGSDRRDTVPVR